MHNNAYSPTCISALVNRYQDVLALDCFLYDMPCLVMPNAMLAHRRCCMDYSSPVPELSAVRYLAIRIHSSESIGWKSRPGTIVTQNDITITVLVKPVWISEAR
jgi:hypothetical protein